MKKCMFEQNYNVFGLDDKPCCYLFHKYCNEVDDCEHKQLLRLKQENKKLKKKIKELEQEDIDFEPLGCHGLADW